MEILRRLFTPEFAPRILLSARSTGKRTTRAAYPRSSLPRTAAPTAPAAYSKEAKGTAGFANSRISRCNAPLSAAPALVRVRDAPRRIPSVGRRTSGFFSLTWIAAEEARRQGPTRAQVMQVQPAATEVDDSSRPSPPSRVRLGLAFRFLLRRRNHSASSLHRAWLDRLSQKRSRFVEGRDKTSGARNASKRVLRIISILNSLPKYHFSDFYHMFREMYILL